MLSVFAVKMFIRVFILSVVVFTDVLLIVGVQDFKGLLTKEEREEICETPVSGYPWVISRRKQDYGWGEHTHRAIIVMALNHFEGQSKDEIQLLGHQLDVELSKALLRNETQPMLLSDLGLYIHALIVSGKDPRNFYGLDLVGILKDRLDNCESQKGEINTFALLALVDSRAIGKEHLDQLSKVLFSQREGRKQIEQKIIALHAVACALDDFPQYSNTLNDLAAALARSQKPDGSFGNVYTTALAIQALVAAQYGNWDERSAVSFLRRKRDENVNMISTYYVQRALSAHEAKCFKDRYKVEGQSEGGLPSVQQIHKWGLEDYIQYTLRVGEHPETYFTVSIKVPSNATFFDIMRMSEAEDYKFRFSWHLDEDGRPQVYSISGIPNNAEECLHWRLIEESRPKNLTSSSVKREHIGSPQLFRPRKRSHMIYTYVDAFKPANEIY